MSNDYRSRQERRQKASKANNKKQQPKKGLMKKVTALLLVIGLIGVTAGAIAVFAIISKAPELNPKALETPVSSKLYDKNGDEFGKLYKEENRTKTSLNQVPKVMEDAVIATEDVRFYDHFGIDIRRIGGAVIANVTGGYGSQGGSTITQQVIKNSLLTHDKKITRKIKEAYLAVKLEQRYSKHQILEMYLNKIYYGAGAYGVATASEKYFNKDIKDLELHEAALLAGLPKAPSYYNPFENPDAAEKRRNVVLAQMEKYGYISKKESEEASAIPVTEYVNKSKTEKENDPYNTFVSKVIREVAKMAGYKDPDEVRTAGLEIHTTLDPKAQDAVEEAIYSDKLIKDKNIQAGLVLTDTKTGAIRAIGSGRKSTMSSYYATTLKRQPGSTIKPILDYGPAIEHLKWPTYKRVSDDKLVINDHEFHNYDDKHHGDMTIRKALYESYNLPAIRTWQHVGNDKAEEFSEKLGIEINDDHYSPSYAIGGFYRGPSPIEMAGAYAAFGNKGVYNKPYSVTKIKFPNGKKIEHKPDPQVAMEEYTSYMITDMLKDVITVGTAADHVNLDFPVAGKTGTTNYGGSDPKELHGKTKDAWFAGYSSELTAAVWTGYNSYNDENGELQYLTGETDDHSKVIFDYVMNQASEDLENSDWKRPPSVVEVPMEKGTGKRASEYTPKGDVIKELAVKGTKLPDVSKKHSKLKVPEDLDAKYKKEKSEIKLDWDYPKDLLKKGITFKILYSMDGGGYQELTTQEEKELVVKNVSPGVSYSFQVVAVDPKNKNQSDPATVDVKTEKEKQEEPPFGDGNENQQGGNGEGPPKKRGNPENEDGSGIDPTDETEDNPDSGNDGSGDGGSGDGGSGDGGSGDGGSGDGGSGDGGSGDGGSEDGGSGDGGSEDGGSEDDGSENPIGDFPLN